MNILSYTYLASVTLSHLQTLICQLKILKNQQKIIYKPFYLIKWLKA